MPFLSLIEAAEQTGTSKVDIWRAIKGGSLLAQKTRDGDFVVEAAELFRVFECRGPEHGRVEEGEAAPPKALEPPQTASTNDMAVAFAALQAELRGLLGPLDDGPAIDEHPQDKPVTKDADLAERNAQLAAELAAERAKTERAMAEYTALAERVTALAEARRPMWRRLIS